LLRKLTNKTNIIIKSAEKFISKQNKRKQKNWCDFSTTPNITKPI